MRRCLRFLVPAIIALSLSVPAMAKAKNENPEKPKKVKEAREKKKEKKEKVGPKQVLHVVCFKFNEGVSEEQIDKVCKDFAALAKKVHGIVRYQAGVNSSPEGLNKGFNHCFVLTFKNAKARDEYLPHPAHKEFAETLKDLIADVFVIDFETR